MINLCTKCHYLGIGKDATSFLISYLYNSVLLLAGIVGLLLKGVIFGSYFAFNILMIYLVISSTVGLINNYRGGDICPNCKQSTMKSINTAEAIDLIKRYDLKPGENATETTISESNTNNPFKSPDI